MFVGAIEGKMSSFRFRIPASGPTEPVYELADCTPNEWLKWWSDYYDLKEADDPDYLRLIEKHESLSAEDFRLLGQWKDNAYTPARWKPNVASVAYLIWEQAAEQLPRCPNESGMREFLDDWSNRMYTDVFKSGPVTKRFGLSRATTLLHFVSGGRYPIFDSRVTIALAALLGQPQLPGTMDSYINHCLPVFDELADCCATRHFRMLDKALFSYGKFTAVAAAERRQRTSSVVADSSPRLSYRGEKYVVQADSEQLTEPQLWDKTYTSARAFMDAGRSVVILQISDGHVWRIRPRRKL
jgi:hypothetical protein